MEQDFESFPNLANKMEHLANTLTGWSMAQWTEFCVEINRICRDAKRQLPNLNTKRESKGVNQHEFCAQKIQRRY